MLHVLLLFFNIAFAQNSCLKLEGLNLGCVSSIDHSCFMNKMLDKPSAPCNYVGSPSTAYRVEGPIAFRCKSERITEYCPPEQCNADGCIKPTCTRTSECIEYQPPICNETCIACFNEVIQVNNGVAKGCIVCTRERCPDEPDAQVACPPTYNGLVNAKAEKCSTDQRCPSTAIDPLGNTHQVQINRSSCPEKKLPEPPPEIIPRDCPWKVDKRTTACEPIDPDNRNP